jgi:hypothetical protein
MRYKILLVILFVVVATMAIRLVWPSRLPPNNNNTAIIKNGIQYTATGSFSVRPLSINEASGLQFPFPQNAKNIHYSEYQEWGAYELWVKFESPIDECLSSIRPICQKYSKDRIDHISPKKIALIHCCPVVSH